MKKLWLAILLVFFIKSIAIHAEIKKIESRTGVVDIQLILDHSVAMEDIKRTIKSFNHNIKETFAKKELELKLEEEKLIQRKSTLTPEIFEYEVNQFNQKVNEVRYKLQHQKEQLKQAHAIASEVVRSAIIDIIKRISKETNFNIILFSSQVLYASQELDITAQVLSILNHELTAVEVIFNDNY